MSSYGTRAKRRAIWQVLIGIGFSLFAVAIGGGLLYHQLTQKKPLDKTSLCPADGPLGHIVLLVDKTDPLNFTQRQAFTVTLRELVTTKVPEGHLFSIFVLGEKFEQSAQPLIELCNPGSDVGKSEFTANLKRLHQQYDERFVKPLEEVATSLVANEPANASPIFEMLQLVGINGFRKHAVNGPRRLVVMSDMLHNTPQFTMYREGVDFDVFQSTDYAKKSRADLQGVSVELHYLMNTPRLQTRRSLSFWERYFEQAGARLTDVRRLEG